MSRGGYRKNAGVKSTWKNGKTKTIRVPIVLQDRILQLARDLDDGMIVVSQPKNSVETQQKNDILDSDTKSKTIDLSGISLCQVNGVLAVRLEDLAKVGYEFQPKAVAETVKARLKRLSEGKNNGYSSPRHRRY